MRQFISRFPAGLWTLPLLGLIVWAVAGCGGAPAAGTASPVPAPQQTPEATEEIAALVAMLEPTATQARDTFCIDCHSDAELLQQLAVEPVVEESLNEGSG